MKKTTIVFMIICLALLLYGCNAKNDISNTFNEGEQLDYGMGEEIENGVEEDVIIEEEINAEITTPLLTASADYEVQSLVSLNVRDNPDTTGKILGSLSQNQSLPFIETQGLWHKVLYKDCIAYVSAKSSYSRLKPLAPASDIIEKVIEVGMSVLGTPYEFGSTRIIDYNFKQISAFTGRTFDCSAFVQYSFYKGANINLYGDSRTMSKQGTLVDYSDIKRGDVIFMTSSARQYNTGLEKIGHVGIYLGDNKLLHTYGTGGVRITEFNSFWRGRFISAKSMI
jgi:cell wall-associated NlpC family hydrolase